MNRNEKLVYLNEKGQSVEFSVFSPFFGTQLDGLDGIKNNIYSTKGVGQDGSTVTGDSLDARNITVAGTINSDEGLNRALLISVINPKIPGKLIYTNNGAEKFVNCKVEKAPAITKEAWPQFLVSFYCGNPYWQDVNEAKAEIALWVGDFSFPLDILEEGIMMGHREPSLIVNVLNEGNVPCGMTVEFTALATLTNPSITDVNTQEFILLDRVMSAGEVVVVTTEYGNKRVKSTLSGVTTNAFNSWNKDSTFLQLAVGDNLLRYDAEVNPDNLEVSIYYTPQYLGV